MKNTFLKTIGGTALVILMLAMLAGVRVFAQENRSEELNNEPTQQDEQNKSNSGSRVLEGSWNVQVTRRDCQTGAALVTFAAMNSYMRGGTMSEFGIGTTPSQRTPSHGVWSYTSGRNFTSAFQFFLFAPDGTYVGIQRVRRQMQVSRFGSSFSTTATIEILNPAGTIVATGCGTETATRFE